MAIEISRRLNVFPLLPGRLRRHYRLHGSPDRSFTDESYFTMRVKVAVAVLVLDTASVPVTVNVYVPVAAPGGVVVVDLLEPPHPLRIPSTVTAANIIIHRANDRLRRPSSSNPAPPSPASEIPAVVANPSPVTGRAGDTVVAARAAEFRTAVQSLPV
jgi:hypothetical protein